MPSDQTRSVEFLRCRRRGRNIRGWNLGHRLGIGATSILGFRHSGSIFGWGLVLSGILKLAVWDHPNVTEGDWGQVILRLPLDRPVLQSRFEKMHENRRYFRLQTEKLVSVKRRWEELYFVEPRCTIWVTDCTASLDGLSRSPAKSRSGTRGASDVTTCWNT